MISLQIILNRSTKKPFKHIHECTSKRICVRFKINEEYYVWKITIYVLSICTILMQHKYLAVFFHVRIFKIYLSLFFYYTDIFLEIICYNENVSL